MCIICLWKWMADSRGCGSNHPFWHWIKSPIMLELSTRERKYPNSITRTVAQTASHLVWGGVFVCGIILSICFRLSLGPEMQHLVSKTVRVFKTKADATHFLSSGREFTLYLKHTNPFIHCLILQSFTLLLRHVTVLAVFKSQSPNSSFSQRWDTLDNVSAK